MERGYKISKSEVRPWGEFFVIHHDNLSTFITDNFNHVSTNTKYDGKMLLINPGKRLSWQYHERRSEIWKVIIGPVYVVMSNTDVQPPAKVYYTGDTIVIDNKVRHRLIGGVTEALIAELWCHTDLNNLSDEYDITRVQDDYSR